ncbi:fungal-specific transcription factor domain-containing protein [Ilyonectria robusta]|uniref:fungal-specific transcription factor domain-containing protein n=1 Tax=Ilyonectria robusta TaxID=1079257 RepID=UPI001E8E086D|nr:fungal-specific transcription factor domain-containing protein [Ilyonectria robusta]KAH8656929.1 fungal-specific transcription factor domain-containing protein [Ilyonectria robusta]
MDSNQGDSSNSRPRSSTRSRRRAVEACSFCRKRKIKCNNERPVCVNCKTYDRDCVYEPVDDVAKEAGRERHHRFKRRKNPGDNARDESRRQASPTLSQQGDTPSSPGTEGYVPNSRDDDVDRDQSWGSAAPSRVSEASVARILVSANGVSSYHGRTSALFEDNIQDRPVGADHHPRMSDEWVERGLVAEAARQRQMEQLNFRQGKLDFDGVDPDLGMHLLSLHWNRQHHSFLITYRPAFMRDMACNGPYFSKLLLNAIYFGSSKFSPRLEVRKDPNDVRTAGWKYRERVRELLGGSLDRSDVTTIQALLQMTNSLFALGDERSAAWLYSGLAFRMLVDLGMHVDVTNKYPFSDEDLEIRRRVFWGAFVVDKIQSLYQGRPVSLKDTDALVPIKFLDTYEELEHWQPFAYSTSAPDYPGSPAHSTSTFTFLCKLSITMSDILSCIYTERSFDQSPAELASMLDKLQLKLNKWHDSLPGHLQFDPSKSQSAAFPPPHIFSLHAMHHVLVILLHRPFVADGHLYNTSRSISVDSLMKCASAASSISSLLRAYHRAFSTRRAPYLISYATYVAATIHCRIAGKRGPDSMAHANLVTCLAVFQENKETNSAVQKAAMIIQRLMKKHGVTVDEVSSDALDMNQPSKPRDQDHEPGRLAGRTIPRRSTSNIEQTNSANLITNTHNVATAGNIGTGYSPGSDWMDIDGIIQSFLQESDANGTRLLADDTEEAPNQIRTLRMPQQGNIQPIVRGGFPIVNQTPDYGVMPGGVHPPEAYNNAYEWQQGWWPPNAEATSLEDPLFGFNGSSLDSFSFLGG